jgi:hypothetical protein
VKASRGGKPPGSPIEAKSEIRNSKTRAKTYNSALKREGKPSVKIIVVDR